MYTIYKSDKNSEKYIQLYFYDKTLLLMRCASVQNNWLWYDGFYQVLFGFYDWWSGFGGAEVAET